MKKISVYILLTVLGNGRKVNNTKCPRNRSYILNIFVEKINRARKVQFSPHETATQKNFPHLL
jgi:hypothetical protein